jgi:hypothetical protein
LNIKKDHGELFFTENSLIEKIKSDLVKIKLDVREYLHRIEKYKWNRPKNKRFYDFDLEMDFSENPKNPIDIDSRKYYYKTYHFQKLGLFKREDAPIYWVDLNDLSLESIYALNTFDAETRNYILKQAVSRIFEDINFDQYHNSISKNLNVGFR